MNQTANIFELVAGYEAYTSADQLDVRAAADAPATTPVCVASVAVSVASSWWCASAVSGASVGATYHLGC
ncbi:hypothetical protein ABIB25_001671 [Nakamurella sp. UYEF19]|uniref:LxmA leader domain family RiPP n=1 Tax=Nakamurella sp. UYEF19 TaxID=1756392 RepID=UPI003396335C